MKLIVIGPTLLLFFVFIGLELLSDFAYTNFSNVNIEVITALIVSVIFFLTYNIVYRKDYLNDKITERSSD